MTLPAHDTLDTLSTELRNGPLGGFPTIYQLARSRRRGDEVLKQSTEGGTGKRIPVRSVQLTAAVKVG